MNIENDELRKNFFALYGRDKTYGIRTYFAPGRVNLIGEHTDYNGGCVFPCALTLGTYMLARKRNDGKLRFYSKNMSQLGVFESNLDDLVFSEKAGWTNYPKGVMWAFREKGIELNSGFDILIYGNIPKGSGLSSSASVEVVTGVMLKDVYGLSALSLIEVALMGQYAENRFNGMNCGIMDQFSVGMGKKDHALYLNTMDLTYQYIPLRLKDVKIVIANSNKKRKLTESVYNERRKECEYALKELQSVKRIASLGELTEEEFEEVKDAIQDDVRRKRAKHAVYENQRTKKAIIALEQGDLNGFGRLMNESHISLREDYEVTGKELDTLVEEAWDGEGVIGSRMTGAGFGGCTVSLVKERSVEIFVQKVGDAYRQKIGYPAEFYIAEIGDGARVVRDEWNNGVL